MLVALSPKVSSCAVVGMTPLLLLTDNDCYPGYTATQTVYLLSVPFYFVPPKEKLNLDMSINQKPSKDTGP